MSEVRLSAETRTEFGKGFARRTRRAGKVPAVIYGHGAAPRHIALPAHEFANALRHNGANVLLTLDVEGSQELVIAKSITRHPIKGYYEHVDLLAVRRGEKVTVDVPITVLGDVVPGALLNQESTTVSLQAEATNLPTGIELDVSALAVGTQVTAADLELPAGATLAADAASVIVIIAEAPSAEQLDAEVAASEADLGIVEDAPGDDADGAAQSGTGPAGVDETAGSTTSDA